MKTPDVSWKENSVVITYKDTEISYPYSSLPDSDLIIKGLDLSEFNQRLNDLRYHPDKFVRNFKGRNYDPAGYQRCRALILARIYPNQFEIVSQSFCTLAYRYLYNDMGSIDELEKLYKDLQSFNNFHDPCGGKYNYRWVTSIWTALAHCYVKEENSEEAFKFFDKVHSYADIKLWPTAMVNVVGACYVTGQSEEYSINIYEEALHKFEVLSLVSRLSVITTASRILEVIMGKEGVKCPTIYTKANSLLKTTKSGYGR
tara:strand:+ start:5228 stop:6001 length:774 start_codon:yes stop_codon:yes gene_type:complete